METLYLGLACLLIARPDLFRVRLRTTFLITPPVSAVNVCYAATNYHLDDRPNIRGGIGGLIING